MTTSDRPAPGAGGAGPASRPALPPLEELKGMQVRDQDGNRLGKVDDLYVDRDQHYARYLAVKTGWLGSKRHVIPVDEITHAQTDGAYLVVPYTKDQLEAAPTYDEGEDEVTTDREREIYRHYGRPGYWEAVRARQTIPAPTPEVAGAEVEDALERGEDPERVRVRRWGV